jgi:hypothetical protein
MRGWKIGASVAAIGALGALLLGAALGAFSSASPVAKASNGEVSSIKVHGNWTIQVKDQGRVVKTVRFHNDLNGGDKKIIDLLSRQKSMGQWMVLVLPAMCGADGSNFCWMDEGIPGTVAENHTVTVTTPSSGADAGKLVLKANLTPTKDAAITAVNTSTVECPATTAPATPCHDNGFGGFSSRNLPAPGISVVAGQQVLITVKYSFT